MDGLRIQLYGINMIIIDLMKDYQSMLEDDIDFDEEDISESELLNDEELLKEFSSLDQGNDDTIKTQPLKKRKDETEDVKDPLKVQKSNDVDEEKLILEKQRERLLKEKELKEQREREKVLAEQREKALAEQKEKEERERLAKEKEQVEKERQESEKEKERLRQVELEQADLESQAKKPKPNDSDIEDFILVDKEVTDSPNEQTPIENNISPTKTPNKPLNNEVNTGKTLVYTDEQLAHREKRLLILKDILERQIQKYGAKEVELKKVDRKRALEFHKLRLISEDDLHVVQLALTDSSEPIPEYKVEVMDHEEEFTNHHLSSYEMEIEIVRVEDIKPLSVKETGCDSFVVCSFPYPDTPQKIKTHVVKNTFSPVFDFKGKVRIEREKKVEKVFEKKKLLFEVYKPATWFLGSTTLVGRAEVPMTNLLKECDMYYSANLMLEKKPVGKIHVNMKVKTPLRGKAVHKYQTKRLHLLKGHESLSNKTLSSNVKPVKVEPVARTGTSNQAPTKPQSTAKPVSTPKQTTPSDDVEDGEFDINTVISHDVMVYEKEKATRLLVEAKRRRDNDAADDLSNLIQMLDMKIQVMIIQCQNGQITPESYSEAIKSKITEEKLLALRLKKAGRIDKAKEALIRVKIMEKEAGL